VRFGFLLEERLKRLYYAPGACSLAVHIVLEWIGNPYEAIKINYGDPLLKQINPAGAVPVLEDGAGHTLTQCSAILKYLAQADSSSDLLDVSSPEAAAELDRWSAFLTGDLHPAFFPVFMPARYTISTEPKAVEDIRIAGRLLVKAKLQLLEAQLDGKTWMVGNKRTILDAYATPMIRWACTTLGQLDEFPAVLAHHHRMLADPAVQRVLAAEGLTAS
jgi:glutathione S-transferase